MEAMQAGKYNACSPLLLNLYCFECYAIDIDALEETLKLGWRSVGIQRLYVLEQRKYLLILSCVKHISISWVFQMETYPRFFYVFNHG
jgi:hypothetical protein